MGSDESGQYPVIRPPIPILTKVVDNWNDWSVRYRWSDTLEQDNPGYASNGPGAICATRFRQIRHR
jgi:hypothetical protein